MARWLRTPIRRRRFEKPAPVEIEIPTDQQKPKADKALTLVNFVSHGQRLIDQIAVPANTNEEAAVALHLPKMDLRALCVTADAAHITKANARQLSLINGADYLLALKGNQPHALAKAQQLLSGSIHPLRLRRSTKTTVGLKSGNCGAATLNPKPWDWPGWRSCYASSGLWMPCARARSSNTPRTWFVS